MKKISTLGLGYIGLPTSIIAAKNGFTVVGFDVDAHKVERINNNDPVITEPDVFAHLTDVLREGTFRAVTQIEPSDCFIIAVPTPFKEKKKADLSFVFSAADTIATVLKKQDIVVLESTVPVGTTDRLARYLQEKTGLVAGIDFFVAHCPERVLPGKIFYELVNNPRIVGGINKESLNKAKQFYKQFVKAPLYLTNSATAEMVKLVENSSRDVEIAFAQQVASMAYTQGLNPFEVIELANKHPRVNILNPSCGVGGHCIAVDPWFLIETFPEQTSLLQAARKVNDYKPHEVIQAVQDAASQWHQKYGSPYTCFVMGLTYKPDVDDMRESPAMLIAQELNKLSQVKVSVCEPHIDQAAIRSLGLQPISLQEGIEQADMVLCLVKHSYFKSIDTTLLAHKKVLDMCGLFYTPKEETDVQEKSYWPEQQEFNVPPTTIVQGEL